MVQLLVAFIRFYDVIIHIRWCVDHVNHALSNTLHIHVMGYLNIYGWLVLSYLVLNLFFRSHKIMQVHANFIAM